MGTSIVITMGANIASPIIQFISDQVLHARFFLDRKFRSLVTQGQADEVRRSSPHRPSQSITFRCRWAPAAQAAHSES